MTAATATKTFTFSLYRKGRDPRYDQLRESPPPGCTIEQYPGDEHLVIDCTRETDHPLDAIADVVHDIRTRFGLLLTDLGAARASAWRPEWTTRDCHGVRHVAQYLLYATDRVRHVRSLGHDTEALQRFLLALDAPGYEQTMGKFGRPKHHFVLVDALEREAINPAFDLAHATYPAGCIPTEVGNRFALICDRPGRNMLHAIGATVAEILHLYGLPFTTDLALRMPDVGRVEDPDEILAALLLLAAWRGAAIGYNMAELAAFLGRVQPSTAD